jgi:hypothetical protein
VINDCKYLNKKLGCDNTDVRDMLGKKLKTCVKIQDCKNACEFKKEYRLRRSEK